MQKALDWLTTIHKQSRECNPWALSQEYNMPEIMEASEHLPADYSANYAVLGPSPG